MVSSLQMYRMVYCILDTSAFLFISSYLRSHYFSWIVRTDPGTGLLIKTFLLLREAGPVGEWPSRTNTGDANHCYTG